MAKSSGLKKQIRQVNPKMGFICRANMALGNPEFKDEFGLILETKSGREKKRRRRRRRGEVKAKLH